jgi:hypothetical protein
MRVFMVFLALFVKISVSAQNITHSLDTLVILLSDVLDQQKEVEIEEIKGVYKLTFWHFIPSVNYDFINNRYYLTLSSSALVGNMISRRQEQRRLSTIERRYEMNLKSREIQLKNNYLSLIQRLNLLQASHEIVLNDIEIFKIKLQEFENHEIDTESFLREKSSILNKIRSHNSDVSEIQRLINDIELLTEFVLEFDFSKYFVSTDLLTI